MCYDLAHQIRWAKHTFSGRYDITPVVCCSFGGHSTPQFLQCKESCTGGMDKKGLPCKVAIAVQLLHHLEFMLTIQCTCIVLYICMKL